MRAFASALSTAAVALALTACASGPQAPGDVAASAPKADVPTGSTKGNATVHSAQSLKAAVDNAWVSLPASVTGGAVFNGLLKDAPRVVGKAPVVVFVHGSSGVAPAIKEWQKWLASDLGVASLSADSMQLPDRMTYKSPIAKAQYELVHTMRAQELSAAIDALATLPWADSQRLVIAGTSEGAVAVARYQRAAAAPQERGRMLFSWSCEDNYHVQSHRSNIPNTLPVLNVMSSTDVYFSPGNPWLGNSQALGHCGKVLAGNTVSSIVLIPGAPHTLFNLPQARQAEEGFLRGLLLSK